MLKLTLVNFKQHKDLKVEFPTTGLVRLYGKSGAGKTSIFDAVRFAITGEGDDISPWDGSVQTIVELEYKDLYIRRTRASATLMIKINDNTYHDDAAEAEIVKYFNGFNDPVFLAASYIRAGMEESLLHLTPAEQLNFIEALTSSPYDEKIKEEIAKKISSLGKDLAEITLKVNFLNEKLTQTITPLKPEKPVITEETLEQFTKIVESLSQREDYKNKIAALHNQLNDPLYTKKDIAASQHQETLELIESKTNTLSSVSDFKWLPPPTPEFTQELRDQKLKRGNVLAQMRALSQEISKTYGSALRQADLEKVYNTLTEDKQRLLNQPNNLQETYRDLLNLRNVKHCPHCGDGLLIQGSDVVKYTNPPDNLEELILSTKQKIETHKQEQASIDMEIGTVSNFLTSIKRLKDSLPEDPYPSVTIQDIDQSINAWKTEAANAKAEAKLVEQTQSRLKQEIGELQTKLKQINELLSLKLRPKSEIMSEISELNQKTEQLSSFINLDECKSVVEQVNTYKKAADIFQVRNEQYEQQLKEYNAFISELQTESTKQKELEKLLAAAKRLKERSDAAAMESIDGVLGTINSYAKPKLDRMFPNDGTSIVLKNQSVTQKGEIRPKISMDVIHKSKTVKKLRSLSLGEKSRAYLAFQLAVTELYSSPFLMVDEGFPGLPDDQLLECLEILQEESKNKLILVIEHGAPDHIFDNVVTIDG